MAAVCPSRNRSELRGSFSRWEIPGRAMQRQGHPCLGLGHGRGTAPLRRAVSWSNCHWCPGFFSERRDSGYDERLRDDACQRENRFLGGGDRQANPNVWVWKDGFLPFFSLFTERQIVSHGQRMVGARFRNSSLGRLY